MGKSARASRIKTNKAALRKKVFGPVETARNERLSTKLLQLASKEKEPRGKMDVEEEDRMSTRNMTSSDRHTDSFPAATITSEAQREQSNAKPVAAESNDIDMDNDLEDGKSRLSKREVKRRQSERAARVEKKRKPRNRTTFASHPMKKKKNGGKR